jgi:hypothetical protein
MDKEREQAIGIAAYGKLAKVLFVLLIMAASAFLFTLDKLNKSEERQSGAMIAKASSPDKVFHVGQKLRVLIDVDEHGNVINVRVEENVPEEKTAE